MALALALAPRLASACECGTEHASTTPAAITVAPDNNAALHAYAVRAAALRAEALRTGTLDYQQVIEAAYEPGVIDDAAFAAKTRWRAIVGHGFIFLADYTQLHDRATVQPLVALADPSLQSTLVAQYESILHVIGISTAATDFAIFHEAGHALQRASLRTRGGTSGRRFNAPGFLLDEKVRDGSADATTVQRLLYLSSQDEFEVRLQDLNRFHARLVAGRPILQPFDTIRALVALGMPLTYEETRDAFAIGDFALTPEEFDAAVKISAPDADSVAVAFEDARELVLLRRLAHRVAPAYWPRLLAKIVFEAPGHL